MLLSLLSCAGTGSPSQNPEEPLTLHVNVLDSLPHDTSSYTQGFEIADGILWESTGLYTSSTLQKLDPVTGQVNAVYPLPDSLFGEGLTVVGDTVYQLTWRSGLVLKWYTEDPVLTLCDTIETDGWGICSVNDSTVITSDGTASLYVRDLSSFDTRGTLTATIDGSPVNQLNELEYAGGYIYANRYYSDYIYRIDPSSGEVSAMIDASSLRTRSSCQTGVLNGIAWDEDRQAFLLTGKNWPAIYITTFVE